MDCIFEEAYLVYILCLKEIFDDLFGCLQLFHVEDDSLLVTHRQHVLQRVSLHEFGDLDALEGANLFDVVLERGESSTHTDHNMVRFDH
jgi:hypothetical protein